jgi:pimeloyl-ACP methyl ester carboxylesterase
VSSITTDQGIVHYEVYGRGKPVILLHGWLGSWGLWQETMGYLGRYYRTYAMDFWGFGESGKKRETYAVQDFVSLVDQFMEQLGIRSAPLVGHSMGGTVSLSVAIRYPERVSKVVVVGEQVRFAYDLVLPRGGVQHLEWTGRFDGNDYLVQGVDDYVTYAYSAVDARTFTVVTKVDQRTVAVTTVTMSEDGRTLTSETAGRNARGEEIVNRTIYEKVE